MSDPRSLSGPRPTPPAVGAGGAIPASVDLVRPSDLAVIRFSFRGLTLRRGRLVGPGLLVATFPPQHLLEEAFFETAPGLPLDATTGAPTSDPDLQTLTEPVAVPASVRLAGPSRVVFEVAKDTAISLTAEGLLIACATLPLRVPANALPPPLPRVIGAGFNDLGAVTLARLARGDRLTAVSSVSRAAVAAARVQVRFGSAAARSMSAAVGAAPRLGSGRVPRTVAGAVPAAARPRAKPVPASPGPFETAIELPYRLLLSPHAGEGFAHSAVPVERAGRVELWHSRLTARTNAGAVDELATEVRTVRGIWNRDRDEPTTAPTFRASLTSDDRSMIVDESSNFTLSHGTQTYEPPVVGAKRLMLSALGGWLDSRLAVETLPDDFSLTEWRHRATMGRDHEVRVVYAGFLFPFGHHASLIKVSERRFDSSRPGNPAALFQRMYIVVRQDERSYGQPLADGQERLDRLFPFVQVHIATRVTPLIDDPGATNQDVKQFVPYVAGRPFRFQLTGVDVSGRTVEWSMPLWFVDRRRNNTVDLRSVIDVHEHVTITDGGRSQIHVGEAPMARQRVALAPEGPDTQPDATTVEPDAIVFSARAPDVLTSETQDEPRFVPVMASATVVIASVARVTGTTEPAVVTYAGAYARNGFEPANKAEVFLAQPANGTRTAVRFASTDRSGGLVNPSFTIGGLSRRSGPIGGDADHAADNGFTASQFFDLTDAKLFGLVSLAELIVDDPSFTAGKAVPELLGQSLTTVDALLSDLDRLRDDAAGLPGGRALGTAITQFAAQAHAALAGGPAPNVGAVTTALDAFDPGNAGGSIGRERRLRATLDRARTVVARSGFAEDLGRYAAHQSLPEVQTGRLTWRPKVHDPNGVFKPRDEAACLTLEVDRRSGPDGTGSADITCTLEDFTVHLVPGDEFLTLHMDRLELVLAEGRSPDVKATFNQDDGIKFAGSLSFVEQLKSLIPLDGFSDPPDLDTSTDGIAASYSIGLPDLAMGVLSLENLSLGARLKIPFIGHDPVEAGFNFCTRDNPFTLTVAFIGGGGFFGLTVTPSGVRLLEAALEFGADISVNFGIASGGVSVMAGIYYRLERRGDTDHSSLTGYFRMRGELSVLGGLFSAAIELYLSLTYEDPGKVSGRAELTIEVHIIFFSISVTIAVEKRFSGSAQDPSFVELMGGGQPGARPWDEYCQAFAEA